MSNVQAGGKYILLPNVTYPTYSWVSCNPAPARTITLQNNKTVSIGDSIAAFNATDNWFSCGQYTPPTIEFANNKTITLPHDIDISVERIESRLTCPPIDRATINLQNNKSVSLPNSPAHMEESDTWLQCPDTTTTSSAIDEATSVLSSTSTSAATSSQATKTISLHTSTPYITPSTTQGDASSITTTTTTTSDFSSQATIIPPSSSSALSTEAVIGISIAGGIIIGFLSVIFLTSVCKQKTIVYTASIPHYTTNEVYEAATHEVLQNPAYADVLGEHTYEQMTP